MRNQVLYAQKYTASIGVDRLLAKVPNQVISKDAVQEGIYLPLIAPWIPSSQTCMKSLGQLVLESFGVTAPSESLIITGVTSSVDNGNLLFPVLGGALSEMTMDANVASSPNFVIPSVTSFLAKMNALLKQGDITTLMENSGPLFSYAQAYLGAVLCNGAVNWNRPFNMFPQAGQKILFDPTAHTVTITDGATIGPAISLADQGDGTWGGNDSLVSFFERYFLEKPIPFDSQYTYFQGPVPSPLEPNTDLVDVTVFVVQPHTWSVTVGNTVMRSLAAFIASGLLTIPE